MEADLLDGASLRRVVAATAPDELYHLAAPTFVPGLLGRPDGDAAGDRRRDRHAARRRARRWGTRAPRVWVSSSSEIFGDAGESPQHERSPMRPRTPYGVAKLAAHGLVGALRAQHGLFACSGITFNHESPRRPERFLPRKVTRGVAAISLGLESELVLGDLGAVRDWSHAADVARGAWLALQAREPGDYVLASGVGRTVGDLVEAAFGHVGLDPERHVRVDPALVRPPESTPMVGDPARARDRAGLGARARLRGDHRGDGRCRPRAPAPQGRIHR